MNYHIQNSAPPKRNFVEILDWEKQVGLKIKWSLQSECLIEPQIVIVHLLDPIQLCCPICRQMSSPFDVLQSPDLH